MISSLKLVGGIEVILSGLKGTLSNKTCVQRYGDDDMMAALDNSFCICKGVLIDDCIVKFITTINLLYIYKL